MDDLVIWIVAFGILSGAGATAASALVMLMPEHMRQAALPWLLSYAAGTLLGAAFLGMIPMALAQAEGITVSATLLAGIVTFFSLERLMIYRHCHDDGCQVHGNAGPLILLGDAIHNLVDGAVIAAAFLTSIPLGIATALAVIAHELPQEVGDFAILLDSGYKPRTAFALNILSAATTLPGALIAYFWLAEAMGAVPYVLAASAASFIYIAVADLIPALHRQTTRLAGIRQFALLISGIATVAIFSWRI